jgi:hypothetical protein
MERPDFAESECPCARREREEDGKEPRRDLKDCEWIAERSALDQGSRWTPYHRPYHPPVTAWRSRLRSNAVKSLISHGRYGQKRLSVLLPRWTSRVRTPSPAL